MILDSTIILGWILFLFLLGWLGSVGYVLFLSLRDHLKNL